MYKKFTRVFSIIIAIAIIIAILMSIAIFNNDYHTSICSRKHCIMCDMTCTAQTVIGIIVIVCIYVAIGYWTIIISTITHENVIIAKYNNSLVSQEVQFNE